MKCLITKKETLSKTKGLPISREGRELINGLTEAHNANLSDMFVKAHAEKGMTEDQLRKLAPSINKSKALRLLGSGDKYMLETLETFLGE